VIAVGERSLLLDVGIRAVFHTALLFGVFLLFAGHNAPGGGFIGGLVTAAGVRAPVRRGPRGRAGAAGPVPPRPPCSAGGLALAVLTGVASWLFGGDLLESGKATLDVPLLGDVKVTSALPFDIGVYSSSSASSGPS
jgi:multisubunit Na+/H+ antiporter MnhB subunit